MSKKNGVDKPEMDINLQKAFVKTLKRQEFQDKINVNRKKVSELGQIIQQSPEMKQIRVLGKTNRSLGQQISMIQGEIDKIIVSAEVKFRREVVKAAKK